MKGEAGFSLIELIVVVTIVGILAAVAIPSFRGFIASQRIKTASFDLMSMITLTRSEAIKRNSSATLSGIGGNMMLTAGGVTVTQREAFVDVTVTCKSGGATVACANVVYGGNGRLTATVPSIELNNTAVSNQQRCISLDLSGRPVTRKGAC